MHRALGTAASLVVLAAATNACSPPSGEPASGAFVYVCVSEEDRACTTGEIDEIAGAIAVTGRFDLIYTSVIVSRLGPVADVVPASTEVVEDLSDPTHGPGLRFRVAGDAAFLAINATWDIIDFTYLGAEEVADIGLTRDAVGIESLELLVGERQVLAATAVGSNGSQLAGTMRCSWLSADRRLMEATPSTSSCRAAIRGKNPGSTSLLVTLGSRERELTVRVRHVDDPDG
jgi:hypothetical protein